MRVLVCGGRDFSDSSSLWGLLDGLRHQTGGDILVIQGGARGADQIAREWCKSRMVQCYSFPADWTAFGKAAGPIRNQQMINEGKPMLVVAAPGGRGTADMKRRAKAAGIPIIEIPA